MKHRGPTNDSGGPNAPRLANGNINWVQVYNQHLLGILREQIAPNTGRGLMYQLKALGVLKKSDYGGLIKHLVQWRLDEYIPWGKIADGSGRGIINDFIDFEEPKSWIDDLIDLIKNGGQRYHEMLKNEWRWHGQPNYVEFMSEKHAVTGTIHAYTKPYYVKISFNRGNNGWGTAYDYVEHLKEESYYRDLYTNEVKRRNIYIWYLGDDDKYGRNMDRQLRGQLSQFGILNKVHFERIAVLPEQIAEYGIPRADDGGGYEIDALNAYKPKLFKQLLLDHIVPYYNEDIFNKLLEKYTPESIDQMISKRIKFLD